MYRITGYFKEHKVVKYFDDIYDAIDFRDVVDAHYPLRVTFEKGVIPVKEWVYNSWNSVMDHDRNPLKNIPHTNTRHMIMQVLAWMWCIAFSSYFTSMWMFGITAVAHIFILAAIAVTVATFETAKRRPDFLMDKLYHTPSRSRGYMWINGKRITLDKNDPGGEHE
tara:strand:- start:679 stop:1176 length:498 start_codon:yes stop_codon:yes gene_type:complete